MRPLSGLTFLQTVILSLLAVTSARAETITGIVRDAQGGAPLKSMVAAAYNAAGVLQANATTDLNGRYELTVPAGSYRVLAYDPLGFYATQFSNDAPSFEESPQTNVSGPLPVVVNFALTRGATITGAVTTSGGLRPGMTVAAYNLSGTRRAFTVTNATGNYSIVVPAGTYKVVAYDDAGAFAPSFFSDKQTFVDADPITVTAGQMKPSVDFFLHLGARLAGTVTNTFGAAVSNAVVIAYNAAGFQITFAIADAGGRYSMTVPPGTYRLVAIDPAYGLAAGYLEEAGSFDTSPALNLAGGQNRTNLNFRLEPGGRVAGQVVEAGTLRPLRDITVAAYNRDGSLRTFVRTDSNGNFTLLLPAGDFRIAAFDLTLVYATQFYAQSKSFAGATAIASSVGQTVTLQPFALSHGGQLTGTVTDRISGATISGVTVAAYDTAGFQVATSSTFSSGTFRMSVPSGAYRLVAWDPQLRYAPVFAGGAPNFDSIIPVSVSADRESVLNLSMARGTLVNGITVDEARRPIANIRVDALDLQQNAVASAVTKTDGSFQLALVPGSYKFVAIDPDGRYRRSFLGGSSFATASTIAIDATGAPKLTVIVEPPHRRRAVRH